MATTFEKTYQYVMNLAMNGSNPGKNCLFFLKELLMGASYTYKNQAQGTITPTGLWTMYYSCDGTTAGTANDGVDRWTSTFDATKIVCNSPGNAHSWAVLKSPVGLGPVYMIIDCRDNTSQVAISFSKAAPTGGSTTARPTATDEWQASVWNPFSWFPGTGRMHGAVTTDGNFFFFFTVTGQTDIATAGVFQSLADAKANDLYPYHFWMCGTTNAFARGKLEADGFAGMRTIAGGIGKCGPVVYNNNDAGTWHEQMQIDAVDSQIPDMPLRWFQYTAPYSLRGRWYDIRWSANQNLPNMTYEPPSAIPASVFTQCIWLPINDRVNFT